MELHRGLWGQLQLYECIGLGSSRVLGYKGPGKGARSPVSSARSGKDFRRYCRNDAKALVPKIYNRKEPDNLNSKPQAQAFNFAVLAELHKNPQLRCLVAFWSKRLQDIAFMFGSAKSKVLLSAT